MNINTSINFMDNFTKMPIECYDIATKELLGSYKSTAQAAAIHGLRPGSISNSCKIGDDKRKLGTLSRKLNKRVYFKYK